MNEKWFGVGRTVIGGVNTLFFAWIILQVYNATNWTLEAILWMPVFFLLISMASIICLGDGIIIIFAKPKEAKKNELLLFSL